MVIFSPEQHVPVCSLCLKGQSSQSLIDLLLPEEHPGCSRYSKQGLEIKIKTSKHCISSLLTKSVY